jgi:phosphorylase kinase alpha/beta subunit
VAVHGVVTETVAELGPSRGAVSRNHRHAYQQVGRNRKLKLTGRPLRRIKSLTTSRLYQLAGRRVACLSALFLQRDFYLAYDMHFLADTFAASLASYSAASGRRWCRPTGDGVADPCLAGAGEADFFELMQQLRSGDGRWGAG